MGYVKQARILPHCHVLSDDTCGVLDRHQIPSEGHHLAAQGYVGLIEGGTFFHHQRLLVKIKTNKKTEA